MTSFDVHQHLWPEQLIRALEARQDLPRLHGTVLELQEGSFETDLREHELDTRIALLDRYEIDVAVVSLQPTVACDLQPDLAEAYHEGVLELVAAAGGRLAALACAQRREGFVGACISARRVIAGVDELAEELIEAGEVLFVHPGYPDPPPANAPFWWSALVDYTAQMQAAFAAWVAGGAAKTPGLKIVFAVLAGGAPFQLERLAARGDVAEVPENTYFDTSSYGARALRLTAEACGSDRLLFGSDAPVMDPEVTLTGLEDAGLTEAALRENPGRLFA
jgi:predicted TIM-barrel fold metal-dependent hydrolase